MQSLITVVIHVLLNLLLLMTEVHAGTKNDSLLWGPYRPNVYLGIRPRIPNSLLMGLMWSSADDPSDISRTLRHTCEQNEGMAGYGWTSYDARKGGTQLINDTGNKLDLTTNFIKIQDSEDSKGWGLRVRGDLRADATNNQKNTVIFYLGNEDPATAISCMHEQDADTLALFIVCNGTASSLGAFRVHIQQSWGAPSSSSVKSLAVPADDIWKSKSIFMDQFNSNHGRDGLIDDDPGHGNLHLVQMLLEGNFEIDILFSNPVSEVMNSAWLAKGIQSLQYEFDKQFESVYSPQTPFRGEPYTRFSQSLLSNLMGGIGYFYGKIKVQTSSAQEYEDAEENFLGEGASAQSEAVVVDKGPYELFTSVPSRPFFPRGFLWDEGYHLLVVMDWDMDLALEIASSWFNLMDEDGWIAREQILGPEARSKVPPDFQTQYPHYANPPTLFLVIESFSGRLSDTSSYSGNPSRYLYDHEAGKALLEDFYVKMKTHYAWFCRTQAGNTSRYQEAYQGYRWRGRTPQHILTSGLDDYPRAQPPHPEDLHLDALSWVGLMTLVLKTLATFLGKDEDKRLFSEHEASITQSIDHVHWSQSDQAYYDITVVANSVEKVCHKGYISMFPFLTGLMNAHHPHLEAVLNLMRDPEELWTPYGLRSLSKRDHYYGTNENYWRSPVWININYMAVEKLLELAQQPGPHQHKSRSTYQELRLNLVNTVFNSWRETGFAWEQYNPDTGAGQRTQYFTGWTALIVKIMAMPDLSSESGPFISPNEPLSSPSWNLSLRFIIVLSLVIICLFFRRRLLRIWGTSWRNDRHRAP